MLCSKGGCARLALARAQTCLCQVDEVRLAGGAGMSGGGRDCADKEAEAMIAAADKAAVEKARRSSDSTAVSVLHQARPPPWTPDTELPSASFLPPCTHVGV